MREVQHVDDARVERVQGEVIDNLRVDGDYSEVFEPSFSIDDDGVHLLRFSYGFPGFCDRPEQVLDRLRHLCAAFGETTAAHVDRLRPALRHTCVEQPLFGLAYDSPASWRVKVYLQFRDDAGDTAVDLAGAIVGRRDIGDAAAGTPLHLLGLDLHERGLAGAKLYFLHRSIAVEDVGPMPAIAGLSRLENLLRIHRMRCADDPELSQPAEIDFALADNGLLPDQVAPLLSGDSYETLVSRFPIALRRISLALGDSGKTNGYYVLTE